MIRRIIALLSFGALFACGSVSDDGLFDEASDGGEELGTVEQPVIYLNGANTQWGAQTGSDRRACNKTSAGQACSIAKFKKIEVARNPASWTAEQNDQLSLVVFELNQEYGASGWTFLFTDSAAAPPADGVRLLVQKNTSGGGNNGNDIKNYRDFSLFSPVQMTEGQQAGLAAPVGNYQHHGACSTNVFQVRIEAKTTNTNQRLRLLDHAVGNAAVVCMGVGTRADAANSYSQSPINLSTFINGSTAGERCRANVGEMNDLADISRQTASVCAGD